MNIKKRLEMLQNTMNAYMDIIKDLDSYQDMYITDKVRQNLKGFLNSIDKELLERKDIDKVITLRLPGAPEQLAEVVSIRSINGKIWCNADSLWRTIEGLNEQIQEIRAAQMEMQY